MHNHVFMASRGARRRPLHRPVPVSAVPWPERIASLAMFIATLGALTVVDPGAEASFDGPKRFVALGGLAIATAILVGWGRLPHVDRSRRVHLLAAGLFGLALLLGLVSALISSRMAVSLDGMRTVVLFAGAALVGATSARAARAAIIAFLLGASINALLSLLQAGGFQLFHYATVGGRGNTSALLGNDGILAIVAAIACALMLHAVRTSPETRWRSISLAVLFLLTLLVNRSLTAFVATGAGLLVVALGAPKRILSRAAIAAVALVIVILAFPGTRQRVLEVRDHISDDDFNALTSYRLGPWMSAIEMVRAKPLLGVGPGNFGAEFVPHLVKAQLSTHHRLGNPFLTGSYVQAHSDYLQLLAEGGVLTFFAMLAACGVVVRLLFRETEKPAARELLIVTVVGGTAALTWFAVQIPAVAIVTLVALGRGWALTLERDLE